MLEESPVSILIVELMGKAYCGQLSSRRKIPSLRSARSEILNILPATWAIFFSHVIGLRRIQ